MYTHSVTSTPCGTASKRFSERRQAFRLIDSNHSIGLEAKLHENGMSGCSSYPEEVYDGEEPCWYLRAVHHRLEVRQRLPHHGLHLPPRRRRPPEAGGAARPAPGAVRRRRLEWRRPKKVALDMDAARITKCIFRVSRSTLSSSIYVELMESDSSQHMGYLILYLFT